MRAHASSKRGKDLPHIPQQQPQPGRTLPPAPRRVAPPVPIRPVRQPRRVTRTK
jgi:hypothetical protein